jgi:hypothetical protein
MRSFICGHLPAEIRTLYAPLLNLRSYLHRVHDAWHGSQMRKIFPTNSHWIDPRLFNYTEFGYAEGPKPQGWLESG